MERFVLQAERLRQLPEEALLLPLREDWFARPSSRDGWFVLQASSYRSSVALRVAQGAAGSAMRHDALRLAALHANAWPEAASGLRSLLVDAAGQALALAPAGPPLDLHRPLQGGGAVCDWRAVAVPVGAEPLVACLRGTSLEQEEPVAGIALVAPSAWLMGSDAPAMGLLLNRSDGVRILGQGPGPGDATRDWAIKDETLWLRSESSAGGWDAWFGFPLRDLWWENARALILAALLFTASLVGLWLLARRLRSRVLDPAREARTHLAEGEAFQRAVIAVAPTGLASIRIADAALIEGNATGRKLLGDESVRRAIVARGREGFMDPQADFLVQADGGVEGPLSLRVASVPAYRHGEGVLVCAVGDVTAQTRQAEALARAKRQVEAANLARSNFLAALSHEIRTPLQAMLGSLDLLALDTSSPRQREQVDAVQQSGTSLLHLLNDLQDFARIESGELQIQDERFDPLTLIEAVVREHAALASAKGLALYCCLPPDLPILSGDPARLRRILDNLVSNAIRSTPGGRVVVSAKASSEREHCRLSLSVEGSGVGIAADARQPLFASFVQGSAPEQGQDTGLGLAVCRRLVALLGGQISVSSERGKGSTCSVELDLAFREERKPAVVPLLPPVHVRVEDPDWSANLCALLRYHQILLAVAPEEGALLLGDRPPPERESPWVWLRPDGPLQAMRENQAWVVGPHAQASILDALMCAAGVRSAAGSMQSEASLPRLGLRVLVAEDHPITRLLLRDQLEALACAVVLAEEGGQARARWNESDFDLLLTDVNMPVVDGYALTRGLREAGSRAPIIGVTASAADAAQCRDAGMNASLTKPVRLDALAACLAPFRKAAGEVQRPAAMPIEVDGHTLVRTLGDDAARIASAVSARQWVEARHQVHRSKGTLAAIGAMQPVAACELLERALEAEDVARIAEAHADLVAALAPLVEDASHRAS
ncbi:ATP-binding protein [Niveibacterium sp. SC-1]|uniref:hybrid sensor histidine kinase/response regulator n=1 Tax=Niveibacterium sp. SC-1 TaxID=3135646 RepID=UPI00311D4353